jgi:hypothetical protein
VTLGQAFKSDIAYARISDVLSAVNIKNRQQLVLNVDIPPNASSQGSPKGDLEGIDMGPITSPVIMNLSETVLIAHAEVPSQPSFRRSTWLNEKADLIAFGCGRYVRHILQGNDPRQRLPSGHSSHAASISSRLSS